MSLSLVLALVCLAAAGGPILERNIHVLTLNEANMADRQRTPIQPQMQCSGECTLRPHTAQCTNQGTDDQGVVNWKCEFAGVPNGYHVVDYRIRCEGWAKSGDPQGVRPGSCVVDYSMSHTRPPPPPPPPRHTPPPVYVEPQGDIPIAVWYMAIFAVLMIGGCIISCCGTGRSDFHGQLEPSTPLPPAPPPFLGRLEEEPSSASGVTDEPPLIQVRHRAPRRASERAKRGRSSPPPPAPTVIYQQAPAPPPPTVIYQQAPAPPTVIYQAPPQATGLFASPAVVHHHHHNTATPTVVERRTPSPPTPAKVDTHTETVYGKSTGSD